jgi:hypothetical protein
MYLNDGAAFGYDQVLTYDGYINFHKSATELNVLVAQGDIGQNELTGKNKLCFSPKDVPGISGTVELAERINQTTLVTISFQVLLQEEVILHISMRIMLLHQVTSSLV